MITMHGPALDGSGETKEVEVDPANVAAFKASGYVEGALPKPVKIKTDSPDDDTTLKGKKGKKEAE